MAVSPFKTFSAGEVLTASDLNSSFTQITNNGEDLGWPATKAKDLDGNSLIIDGDGDTQMFATTDDRIDFQLQGNVLLSIDGTEASAVDGFELVARATGSNPFIRPKGTGTNVKLELRALGATGAVILAMAGGEEILVATPVASAVNYIEVKPSVTTADLVIAAAGDDADIDLDLQSKGTGSILINGSPVSPIDDAATILSGQVFGGGAF